MAKYNEKGEEIPDPTPMAIPVGYNRPETLAEMVQRMTRREVSRAAEAVGHETFEEADDFEVGDDELVISEHQLTPMQEEYVYEREHTPVGGDGTAKAPAGDAGVPTTDAPKPELRSGRRATDAPKQAEPYQGPERRGAPIGRKPGQ